MTQEEKAKAYDEAIKRLEDIETGNCQKTFMFTEGLFDYIFPELKESEGERIRKELLNYLYDVHDDDEERARWIAWLEKQGEQKPVLEIEPTPIFKIGDILKRKGKDYTFRVDRIQGGYYHCDRNHGAFFPIEEQGNWELVEQNSTWSEEDATHYNRILKELNLQKEMPINASVIEEVKSDIIWLKSLKDRVQPQKQEWSKEDEELYDEIRDAIYYSDCVETAEDIENMKETLFKAANWMEERAKYLQPQPRQEWSEEDESNISELCSFITESYSKEDASKLRQWLKSIRPQTTWKPSDGQMRAIEHICDGNYNVDLDILDSIYRDFKKLREE